MWLLDIHFQDSRHSRVIRSYDTMEELARDVPASQAGLKMYAISVDTEQARSILEHSWAPGAALIALTDALTGERIEI